MWTLLLWLFTIWAVVGAFCFAASMYWHKDCLLSRYHFRRHPVGATLIVAWFCIQWPKYLWRFIKKEIKG